MRAGRPSFPSVSSLATTCTLRSSRWVRIALFLTSLFPATFAAAITRADSDLQVFVRIDGTVPEWTEMGLTLARLQVDGHDATGRRYSAVAFGGTQAVTIPRGAEGSPRLLVGGAIPAGRVSQVVITFSAASLTTDPAGATTSRRTVPVQVTDNPRRLQLRGPLTVEDGGTLSLLVPIRIGADLIIGKNGVPVLRPTLAAQPFTPAPEDYVDGSEIVTRGPTQLFPELEIEVLRSKVLNPTTAAVRDLTLRTDNGAPVSFSELRAENESLWRDSHGALNPALVQKLSTLAGADLVLADIWLRVPGDPTFISNATTPAAWDAAHSAFVAGRRAAAIPIVEDVSNALTAAGATVLSTELNPAVLHVQASRSVLETVASQLLQVIEIVETEPDGDILATQGAVDLVQTPLWLAHLLLAGQGLRIALVEPQACIQKDHEAFRDVFVEEPVAFPCSDFTGNIGHSTAVAGGLGAAVGPPGSIELVGLFQGRMLTSDICAITDALLQRNPHLINMSCETGSFERRMLDHTVYSDRIFVANGSGNIPTGEDGSTRPVFGFSYNSVCVGGYNHLGTLGPGNFGDDMTAGRWLNDAATHREKPDLVGPYAGSFPNYNDLDDYDPWGGTSFSTPMIVGTAALLMANFPVELTTNPTLTRAVLMASASHSFTGFAPIPIVADNIDDRTGAGAPRGDRADEILDDEQFFTRFVDRAVDFNTAGDLTVPIQFQANPGDKVRVVLTYDQCQDATTSIPDVLIADLDLIVTEAATGGLQVKTNNSHVDNHEIVEFIARPGHTGVNVKVRAQHWDPCTDGTRKTYLAIAWDVLPASEPMALGDRGPSELASRLQDKAEAEAARRLRFRSVTPNPSPEGMNFEYQVPQSGGFVRVRVFDLAGRLISEPFLGVRKGGTYTTRWDATGRDGHRVAPGIYLVQVQMGAQSIVRRVVIAR